MVLGRVRYPGWDPGTGNGTGPKTLIQDPRNQTESRPREARPEDSTPGLAQKRSGGPPGLDFRSIFARKLENIVQKLGQSKRILSYCSQDGWNKFGAQAAGRHGGGYGRRHWIIYFVNFLWGACPRFRAHC